MKPLSFQVVAKTVSIIMENFSHLCGHSKSQLDINLLQAFNHLLSSLRILIFIYIFRNIILKVVSCVHEKLN